MADSKLLKEIAELEEQMNNEIRVVTEKYQSKIEELKNTCNHNYDDGTSAVNYEYIPVLDAFCEICKKAVEWR